MKEQNNNLITEEEEQLEVEDDVIEHKKCYSLKRIIFAFTFISICIFFIVIISNPNIIYYLNSQYTPQPPSEIKNILTNSNIIKSKEEIDFIKKTLRKKDVHLKIFYNSVKDGDSASNFKTKTNLNQILILIESQSGKRFGGYSSFNFKTGTLEQNILKNKISFLLNLDLQKTFNVRSLERTEELKNYQKYTAAFGDGDLIIYDNFLTKGGSASSHDYFREYSTPYELTGGEKDFKIKYLEAFNVRFISEENKIYDLDAALFDLDGTLLDTEPIYETAFQEVINLYGNGKKYDWDVKEKVIGGNEYLGAKSVKEAYEVKLSVEELIKKRNVIAEELFKKCPPCKGAENITSNLKNKYGLKIAVATSSTKYLFDLKTSSHKDWFNKDFDKSILGDDKRLKKGKPEPDIFLLSAKELGVDPKKCIIFEDAINGVKAALASEASVVVAVPMPHFRKFIEQLDYDSSKTQLIILDSLDQFNYSMIKPKNMN